MHAEEDKRRRELVDTRNQADALIYSTEKTLKDLGDKVDAATRSQIDAQIEKLRKAMEGDDKRAIEKEMEQLTQVSHKLAEEMYKKTAEQQAQTGAAGAGASGAKKDDDVVDADFEEVKDK